MVGKPSRTEGKLRSFNRASPPEDGKQGGGRSSLSASRSKGARRNPTSNNIHPHRYRTHHLQNLQNQRFSQHHSQTPLSDDLPSPPQSSPAPYFSSAHSHLLTTSAQLKSITISLKLDNLKRQRRKAKDTRKRTTRKHRHAAGAGRLDRRRGASAGGATRPGRNGERAGTGSGGAESRRGQGGDEGGRGGVVVGGRAVGMSVTRH